MASAGRILIIPKGEWNAETTYKILDLFFYGGTSWISKRDVIGIEPTVENSEYWQNMFDAEAFADARIETKIKEYMESNTETTT